MLKAFTCIVCPNGCEIQASLTEDQKLDHVTGNQCEKGEDYVRTEIENPVRTVTSTVLVRHGELPLASVRLTRPIPKTMIFRVMEMIRRITLEAPVREGEIIISNILGTDSHLIATKTVEKSTSRRE